MSGNLTLQNRCKAKGLEVRALQKRIRRVMRELGRETYDLSIYLVDDAEITRLNETRLRHAGVTDVITFDYSDTAWPELIAGEIFVCVPEAKRQARQFGVLWKEELFRYQIHGVLHLLGYDDLTAAARKKMKREENRVVNLRLL
ncbi:MAG TPA: rRNA maturation RNase YbeY [Candidatus Dormibacteraeota bacterium]|nr:rRNA maturation RNase YbeY [Candidatus Dormibacteraeota bacterium]